ncbi:MAG: hypothetical protein ABSF85_13900 [Terriglobales bacterium]
MAANPLPRPRTAAIDFNVDASTVTGNIGSAAANDTINWGLTPTEPQTSIQVQPVNAHYPFAVNSFTVDPGTTHPSTVLPNTPDASYPFGRNGGAAVGHIIVGPGGMPKPTRAK